MTVIYSNGINHGRSIGERFSIDKMIEHFKTHSKVITKITVNDNETEIKDTVNGEKAKAQWDIETQ